MELALIVLGAALGVGGALMWARRRHPPAAEPRGNGERILFPFVGSALSGRGLQAALRIARAEGATVVPAYLVTVPMPLALDAPVPRSCDAAFEIFEAIEQAAARAGVPVDTRVGRGRTVRHAMRGLMATERFDRIVVTVATDANDGFTAEDVAWLLRCAPGEVVVIRPTAGDAGSRRAPSGARRRGSASPRPPLTSAPR
jgi:hypothetical protein